MVAADQRRVLRARVRCARPDDARHAGVLLADALRTASLPDRGRLIVFRRVDLGRLSPRSSATAWSRRLERELQALADRAVFFAEPAAARAPTVWFPDDWQPAIELAVRLVRGAESTGWFWSAAVPGWRAGLAKSTAASLLFRQLATRGGGSATLALARRLYREGALFTFAEWLTEADLAAWFAPKPTFAGQPDVAEARAVTASLAALPRVWRERLAAFAAQAGGESARTVWAIAGMLSAHGLAPVETVQLRELASGIAASLAKAPANVVAEQPTAQVTSAFARSAEPAASAAEPATTREALAEPASASPGATQPTVAGGLLFTLNLLRRLGWPAWLGESDRALAGAVTRGLWQTLADRLALPADDAFRSWLGEIEPASPPELVSFHAPQLAALAGRRFGDPRPRVLRVADRLGWRLLVDGSGRLPLAAWPRGQRSFDRPLTGVRRGEPSWPAQVDPLIVALALGTHRLCRRLAGLGLRTLIVRPARLAWTETHVDVHFTLNQADLRIRRAGLDFNPGWVPWLGRVVTFHYGEALPA